ncbi:MAG: hypothetical protein ABL993_14915 [Vicinamibacterales bacterium]
MTASQREALEARYRLTKPVRGGADAETTWSYEILDVSTANLRGLVLDQAVADTHHIDRSEYRIADDAWPGGSHLGFLLCACLIAFSIAWVSSWFGRDWRGGIGAVVTRGIPAVPAEVLGFFRIFYATFLFIALSTHRLQIDKGFAGTERSFEWVNWLVSRPDLIRTLENGILEFLVLFALGLFARVTYGLIAAGMTIWITVLLQPASTNIHVWEVSFLTTLCLIPVPWGAAFSLDETLRRWRGRDRAEPLVGRRYGFAMWLPGFVLGAVWAGAAYTKIESSGLEWILGGAVKYHWVIDAADAPVAWGLWVASHHWAAVLLSLFGVTFEALFILSAFVGTMRARIALVTSIGVPLLVSFYLFHGVLWWTWWLVLVSFVLPWHVIFNAVARLVPRKIVELDLSSPEGRRTARFWHGLDWFNTLQFVDTGGGGDVRGTQNAPHVSSEFTQASVTPRGLQPVHAGVVCLVCMLMLTELPEGFGRFTSYSNTYASTGEFDKQNPIAGTDELWIGYGTQSALRVFENAESAEILVDAIAPLSRGEALQSGCADVVHDLGDVLARVYGEEGRRVTHVRKIRTFDWTHGGFVTGDEVVETIDMSTATLVRASD